MAKKRRSFQARRKQLLVTMSKRCGDDSEDMVMPFGNSDVPDFLEKLDQFEAASRKSRLIVE